MGLFSFFSRKRKGIAVRKEESTPFSADLERYMKDDHLGRAATIGAQAKAAVSSGNMESAWKLFHEQKAEYLKHAQRSKFTAAQTLAFDASVHEDLANILRIEGKHDQALVHILYWVSASVGKPTKRHEQKLRAYFNRCKFTAAKHVDALAFFKATSGKPGLVAAQEQVRAWRSHS